MAILLGLPKRLALKRVSASSILAGLASTSFAGRLPSTVTLASPRPQALGMDQDTAAHLTIPAGAGEIPSTPLLPRGAFLLSILTAYRGYM